jgi:hypothetical protein
VKVRNPYNSENIQDPYHSTINQLSVDNKVLTVAALYVAWPCQRIHKFSYGKDSWD